MKYKGSDSGSSGVGKSRPVSSAAAATRLLRDEVPLKTRNIKTEKNVGDGLRRSSRRATIERRVWAVPKKSTKTASASVKEKSTQKSTKREKEKREPDKPQSKASFKSKISQGVKRGPVTLEEAGNARRKVKKKDGAKDVSQNEVNQSVDSSNIIAAAKKKEIKITSEHIVNTQNSECEDVSNRMLTVENKSSINANCIHESFSKCDLNFRTENLCSISVLDEKDTIKNCDLGDSFTEHSDDICGRRLEETLYTGEMCLNTAVIEEVVPDYKLSTCQISDNVRSCTISSNNNSPVHSDVNVLDPLCSNTNAVTEDNSNKCVVENTNIVLNTDTRENNIQIDSPVDQDNIISTEDQCSEEVIVATESVGLQCIEHEPHENDKLQIECRRGFTVHSLNQKTKSIEHSPKIEEVKEKSAENVKCQSESTVSSALISNIEKVVPLGIPTSQDTITNSSRSDKQLGAMVMEEEEEEDHVSLSAALAQLVDAGSCDVADGSETVTIHSASPGIHAGEKAAQEILALEVNTKDSVLCKPLTIEDVDDDEEDVDDDDVEGELIIKEEDDGEEEEGQSSEFDTEEEEEFSKSESKKENQPKSLVNAEKSSDVCTPADVDKEVERSAGTPSPPLPKPKKQMPPLIKVSSRPPAIKTPLKCPECPMQFCTVRSLLWHFGTHVARSRDNCLPPILLQDLIVPWDKPTVSLYISQPPESDKSADKVVNISDNLPVSSAETTVISKQDLLTATPIMRTDDYMGTNGDVILKVPIPRLKPKVTPIVKKDKFVNILPKLAAGDGQTGHTPGPPQLASIRSTNSPTPKLTIHPQGKRTGEIITRKLQKPIPKITIGGENSDHQVQIKPIVSASSQSTIQIQPLNSSSQSAVQIQPLISSQSAVQIQPLMTSSQSAIQIQPLVSSSQSAVQIQPLVSSTSSNIQVQPVITSSKSSTAPGHIALIPMDNLAAVGQNFTSRPKLGNAPLRMMSPSTLPVKTASTPVDGLLEKDGLVMINSNLALRIVSSLPSTLDCGTSTTNTTTIRPIASHLTNNLTILPQVEGSKLGNSKKETIKNPDILTIVPQVDVKKKVSLLKTAAQVPSAPTPSITKSSSSTSQVLKLFLLQPKDIQNSDNTVKISIASDPTNKLNGLEIPLPFPNGNEKVNDDSFCEDDISDDEDFEDEGMVIDDDRDGEEDLMDPLSMCAVTMEDENIDASNSISQSESTNDTVSSTSSDKVAIKVKTKGKGHQGVDIVKYEARKYVCCYCNRRFGWSTDLKRHVILHTGEKPFECKVCPTAFTRKFLLQNHMKRMHPDKCKMSDLWP